MTWPPLLSDRIDFLYLILFLHLLRHCPLRYVHVSATGPSLTSTSPKSAYDLVNLCAPAAHNPLFLCLCQTLNSFFLSYFHSLSYIFKCDHNLLAGQKSIWIILYVLQTVIKMYISKALSSHGRIYSGFGFIFLCLYKMEEHGTSILVLAVLKNDI